MDVIVTSESRFIVPRNVFKKNRDKKKKTVGVHFFFSEDDLLH